MITIMLCVLQLVSYTEHTQPEVKEAEEEFGGFGIVINGHSLVGLYSLIYAKTANGFIRAHRCYPCPRRFLQLRCRVRPQCNGVLRCGSGEHCAGP